MAEIIPTGLVPKAGYSGVAYVVEERPNSSSEFFVFPAIKACGYHAIHCGFTDLPTAEELKGAVVVFVRYVPPDWLSLVNSVRPHLHALIFFMDDDVLDPKASAGMPLSYRLKLQRLSSRHSGWLRRKSAELWVSSPYLQKKYAKWHPKLILPSPAAAPVDVCRVFYHGSVATHDAEIRWLYPVIDEVLHRDTRIAFEIVGNHKIWQLYNKLPRVNVIHTMKWSAYKQFMSMSGRHIGLAPLLDHPFNRARAYTKFFDITHCGAVGIYAPDSIYSDVVSHGMNGIIAEMDPALWVESILTLAQNELMRQDLLRNAVKKSVELADLAQCCYSGLLEPYKDGEKR